MNIVTLEPGGISDEPERVAAPEPSRREKCASDGLVETICTCLLYTSLRKEGVVGTFVLIWRGRALSHAQRRGGPSIFRGQDFHRHRVNPVRRDHVIRELRPARAARGGGVIDGVHAGKIAGQLIGGGQGDEAGSRGIIRDLVDVEKEKELVLDNRPSDRTAKLVVPHARYRMAWVRNLRAGGVQGVCLCQSLLIIEEASGV